MVIGKVECMVTQRRELILYSVAWMILYLQEHHHTEAELFFLKLLRCKPHPLLFHVSKPVFNPNQHTLGSHQNTFRRSDNEQHGDTHIP